VSDSPVPGSGEIFGKKGRQVSPDDEGDHEDSKDRGSGAGQQPDHDHRAENTQKGCETGFGVVTEHCTFHGTPIVLRDQKENHGRSSATDPQNAAEGSCVLKPNIAIFLGDIR